MALWKQHCQGMTQAHWQPLVGNSWSQHVIALMWNDVYEVDVPDRINADPYEPLVFLRWLLAASRRAHQACWLVKPDLDGQGPAAIYQKVCGAGG